MREGTAPQTVVGDALLAKETQYGGNNEEAMHLAMSTICAGSNITRMPLNSQVMAALCHPDAIAKAREEVNAVRRGMAGRLPGIGDIPKMPYTCALVKEVLRWRPPMPTIRQHQLTQDLQFEGYYFPAGTEFLMNSFPIAHDGDALDAFRPERWIDGTEASIKGVWILSGGRRVCVGYKLAQTQIFVTFARLLYCFDYAPAGEYNSMRLGHTSPAEPFPVIVTARSKWHERLIIDEARTSGSLGSARAGF